MAVPGCPEFAFCTASMASVRIVSTERVWTRSSTAVKPVLLDSDLQKCPYTAHPSRLGETEYRDKEQACPIRITPSNEPCRTASTPVGSPTRSRSRNVRDHLDDGDREFVERLDMFFLATVDADGMPDVLATRRRSRIRPHRLDPASIAFPN